MTPKFHPLKISQVRQESTDAISICFDIPNQYQADFTYQPGQHLTLKAKVDGQELRRSYSICSGLDDGEIRIAVKKVPGGVFSTWANESLKAGQEIEVMTPDGKFGLPLSPNNQKHYVGFAAGSGITPILSMVKSILVREPKSTFTLVYGNRRQATTMFQEDLEDLKNRFITRFSLFNMYSGEDQDAPIFNGRLNEQKVSELLKYLIPADSIDEAFICGPGAMIDEVEKALLDGGVNAKHIHLERFGVPVSGAKAHTIASGDAAQAKVTVIQDGLKREVDFHKGDLSILDVALAQGMDLPYSCKGGVCNTCRCKVLEGEVRMDRNFALEPDEVKAGFVLSCQAHPLTEKVVVSFDDR